MKYYKNQNKIKIYPKKSFDEEIPINETDFFDLILNMRFYVDIDTNGDYNIYPNPAIPALKDKNIIGDFFLYKIESYGIWKGPRIRSAFDPRI